MKKRVCDIIMEMLVEHGITDCFAVVGGGAMFLDNALLHNKNITTYFNHHEQACAMAAEAYARATGKLALVCVTSGPGGTNTLTGVMGAWVDSIPMIIISGQVRYDTSVPKTGLQLRTRGVQEFNIVDTVKTMTKYSKLVIDPLDIKIEINKALDIALSGRKGPVWLDIPLDVQSAVVEEHELRKYQKEEILTQHYDLTFLYEELKLAKRPVFLVGAGVNTSGSRESFRELLNHIKIPTVCSINGDETIYRDNPLCIGSIGSCGQRAANFVVQNSDLIISLGCSLNFSTTGFNQDGFAPKAKIIAIDVDDQELKKTGIKLYKTFLCDVKVFLEHLNRLNINYVPPDEWKVYCHNIKNKFDIFEATADKAKNDRVCAYVFWKTLYGIMPHDTVVVLGNNSAITSALQIGNKYPEQHIIANFNCGSMGYDIPAAIGTTIGMKKEVLLVTGDGSFMMNMQELQTIVHYRLPIKIVLFENEGYNAIRQTSKTFFNGELFGCSIDSGLSFPNFKNIANAFGIQYMQCCTNNEVNQSLHELLDFDGPVIMEVKQLLDDPVTPKVMPRIDENGKIFSPVLQDMYPFISQEIIDSLMLPKE